MDKFKLFWRTIPTPWQAATIAAALLLLLIVGSTVGGLVSHLKDRAFDRKEAELEQQRQTLETEREQAIGRATAAEARAAELESQTRILEVTIAAQGQRAEKAREAIANEEKTLAEQNADIDSDVDPCTRLLRLCERAKALGYLPKAKPCECQR